MPGVDIRHKKKRQNNFIVPTIVCIYLDLGKMAMTGCRMSGSSIRNLLSQEQNKACKAIFGSQTLDYV